MSVYCSMKNTDDPKSHFPFTFGSVTCLSQITLKTSPPVTGMSLNSIKRLRKLCIERRTQVASLKICLSPVPIMNAPVFLAARGAPFFTAQLPCHFHFFRYSGKLKQLNYFPKSSDGCKATFPHTLACITLYISVSQHTDHDPFEVLNDPLTGAT